MLGLDDPTRRVVDLPYFLDARGFRLLPFWINAEVSTRNTAPAGYFVFERHDYFLSSTRSAIPDARKATNPRSSRFVPPEPRTLEQ